LIEEKAKWYVPKCVTIIGMEKRGEKKSQCLDGVRAKRVREKYFKMLWQQSRLSRDSY